MQPHCSLTVFLHCPHWISTKSPLHSHPSPTEFPLHPQCMLTALSLNLQCVLTASPLLPHHIPVLFPLHPQFIPTVSQLSSSSIPATSSVPSPCSLVESPPHPHCIFPFLRTASPLQFISSKSALHSNSILTAPQFHPSCIPVPSQLHLHQPRHTHVAEPAARPPRR